jgi:hypothetical protein
MTVLTYVTGTGVKLLKAKERHGRMGHLRQPGSESGKCGKRGYHSPSSRGLCQPGQ